MYASTDSAASAVIRALRRFAMRGLIWNVEIQFEALSREFEVFIEGPPTRTHQARLPWEMLEDCGDPVYGLNRWAQELVGYLGALWTPVPWRGRIGTRDRLRSNEQAREHPGGPVQSRAPFHSRLARRLPSCPCSP
jgi:hypothetical protein